MALPGSTWQQLLNAINNDLARLDLLSSPPTASDIIWIKAQEAIAYYQPDIFIPNQAYLQWTSTFRYQNYYALPSDWETDGQILLNAFGQNVPLTKISEFEINRRDVQSPPNIGASESYVIYMNAQTLFGGVSNAWQANFNYTAIFNANSNPGRPYLILDSNGNIQALTAIQGNGINSGVQPTWPTTIGTQSTDGNVTWTCWFNMANPLGPILRLFPTPDAAYPLTAVYHSKIPMPIAVATSNFWTVDAEPLIRHRTVGLIKQTVTLQQDFQNDYDAAEVEYAKLQGIVRKATGTGYAKAVYL